eukprot:10007918-Karenia_brevis.AAC.1
MLEQMYQEKVALLGADSSISKELKSMMDKRVPQVGPMATYKSAKELTELRLTLHKSKENGEKLHQIAMDKEQKELDAIKQAF